MKIYPIQFIMFPYYEHLQITHLVNTMHIENNVITTLWVILDGINDNNKKVKFCNDIEEVKHSMKNMIHSNSYGHQDSLRWLFIEQRSNVVKGVTQKKNSHRFFF